MTHHTSSCLKRNFKRHILCNVTFSCTKMCLLFQNVCNIQFNSYKYVVKWGFKAPTYNYDCCSCSAQCPYTTSTCAKLFQTLFRGLRGDVIEISEPSSRMTVGQCIKIVRAQVNSLSNVKTSQCKTTPLVAFRQ